MYIAAVAELFKYIAADVVLNKAFAQTLTRIMYIKFILFYSYSTSAALALLALAHYTHSH